MTFEQKIEEYLDNDRNARSTVHCGDSVEQFLDAAVRHAARDGGYKVIEAWLETKPDYYVAAPCDYKAGEEIDIEELVCEALCKYYKEDEKWRKTATDAIAQARAFIEEEQADDDDDD